VGVAHSEGRRVSGDRLTPTRDNLLRARQQLARVRKGADAVSRKRQALVGHLFRIARPAIDTRGEIARRVSDAAMLLLEALSTGGVDSVRAAGNPPRRVEVDVTPAQIWGVRVADVAPVDRVRRTLDARSTAPGSTRRELVAAADAYEALVDLVIAAAPSEIRVARLAEAVASTSRQLRLLRERVEPRLSGQIARVVHTLEEREREEHVRLKHLRASRAARGVGA
jgi:V/A-type H+/Na+-transporting ATPase subunit D